MRRGEGEYRNITSCFYFIKKENKEDTSTNSGADENVAASQACKK